tara:strand:- start:1 stop:138 length:138 start_codon:yes stop_codon:yes gene_type:complete
MSNQEQLIKSEGNKGSLNNAKMYSTNTCSKAKNLVSLKKEVRYEK